MKQKPVVVSGVSASGSLTLGNYLGAIKNIVINQDHYQNYIFVADLHTLTNQLEPKQLATYKKQIYALYLACGIDPHKSTIFFQSDVSAHSELHWILTCQATMGQLARMTQFKINRKGKIKKQNKTKQLVPVYLLILF